MNRTYTEQDDREAALVIDALIANGGEIVGARDLAKVSGVPRDRLYSRVTNRAAQLIGTLFPGSALVRTWEADGIHYRITSDPAQVDQDTLHTLHKMSTMAARAEAMAAPYAGRTDLFAVLIREIAGGVRAAFRAELIDAVMKDGRS